MVCVAFPALASSPCVPRWCLVLFVVACSSPADSPVDDYRTDRAAVVEFAAYVNAKASVLDSALTANGFVRDTNGKNKSRRIKPWVSRAQAVDIAAGRA